MGRKRGAKSAAADRNIVERAEWIVERIEEFGDGIHRLGPPALMLDAELPEAVATICREFDGAELFHESLVLRSGSQIERAEGGRFLVAEWGGDDILVEPKGAVWRFDRDMEEFILEGSRYDRWLAGAIDAETVLYDNEGEFHEGIVGEEGELTPEATAERARRQLKRDPKAVGPRWRLARALVESGDSQGARSMLEEVVASHEDFPWAWFDLARISEKLGEYELACDEAEQAATVREGYDYGVYFLAHATRLAELGGLEARKQELATRVLALDPDLPRRHVDGARERMESEDVEGARELLVLAKVVAPRNLQVIDLLAQIES